MLKPFAIDSKTKPFGTLSLNVKTFQDCQPECQNLSGLSA
jgi:hypothetical protein